MRDITGTLFAPGQRKRNKFYVWKGRLSGRSVEVMCRGEDQRKTANVRIARRFVRRLIDTASRQAVTPPAGRLTFAAAADAYAEARRLAHAQRRLVQKLSRELGRLPLAAVRQADLDRAANGLYPNAAPATRNRNVYAVGAAILHYGADNDWCGYRRIKKQKEARSATRRPSPDVLPRLLAATAGHQRLFILTLFRQGWRISETLDWREDQIDLRAGKTELWISKAKTWKTLPLHDDVIAALASRGDTIRSLRPGSVFPWRQRSDVYRWLRPLCHQQRIEFTPHMARHEFASCLRERAGATARDIRDAGTWTSERSTARYDHAAPERVRALLSRLR
jgi:integrase